MRPGPAEDDGVALVPFEPSAPRVVALAPPEESEPPPAATLGPGLYLAIGGPPQPLRAAPDVAAPALVQVPDGAALEDLGEITPDGAWQRVGWAGWEGWIAAGVLRRRAQ